MIPQNRISIQVAGIVVALTSKYPLADVQLEESYGQFLSTGEPDVIIRAHYGELPAVDFRREDLLFDSGALWSLYRGVGTRIFRLKGGPARPLLYLIAVFAEDFCDGDIYNRWPVPLEGSTLPPGSLPNPLAFPLSEVLMICLLAQGRGMMVHACGIIDGDRGYLFAGNSGHGKSTIARLWQDRALVLNDDRIVVREREGRFWMYGTPWHGEFDIVSPEGVPISKIFFLRHGAENSAVPQRGAQTSIMLLTRSFPPLGDREGMQYTLGLCHRVTKEIPCYELGFVPDQSVVDFIRSLV